MRASFYLTIAIITDPLFMGGLLTWEPEAVLIIYPLAELATVSYFGSYSDKIGRKPILVASLFMTGITAFLFAVNVFAFLLILFGALFGVAVAAKVTTTLSIIADCSEEHNRARLMGYYDLSTLSGLGGGFGLGILLPEFGVDYIILLLAAAVACTVSGFIAMAIIKETKHEVHTDQSILELIKQVASDKKIQKLIPVYVPIISLYGLMLANIKNILHYDFSLDNTQLLILFALLGGSLVMGIIVNGHLSDHFRKRRPFIIVGLISFGVLAYLLVSYADHFTDLQVIWPILPILGYTAGAFPPAAMAYITDISEKETRGSTMGVYSIFFGSGMIIGPAAGLFAYGNYGLPGLIALVAVLILIACIGTYLMAETHSDQHESPPDKEITTN
jgi:MFS family permease